MWISLNDAFVSIVAHKENPGILVVRARRKGDLHRALGAHIEEIESTPDADYAYRAFVARREVAGTIADAIATIDYTNFKSSVDDDALHSAYLHVWSIMIGLQEKEQAAKQTITAKKKTRRAISVGSLPPAKRR